MLTVLQLTAIISSFCGIKLANVNEDYKLACMEKITNCSVVSNGEIPRSQVEKCLKSWNGFGGLK